MKTRDETISPVDDMLMIGLIYESSLKYNPQFSDTREIAEDWRDLSRQFVPVESSMACARKSTPGKDQENNLKKVNRLEIR